MFAYALRVENRLRASEVKPLCKGRRGEVYFYILQHVFVYNAVYSVPDPIEQGKKHKLYVVGKETI